ncbi:helix-turn-helix domain-containing protein [Nonomuraea helvata]|uniref:Uncharacterized protein n=1 Tax=Nonomuraea helvata TaxID=37484 RepID=A0ABV5S6V7_9ACTN
MTGSDFGRWLKLTLRVRRWSRPAMRGRGLVDAAGGFTDAGRETRQRIEALTDELAAGLEPLAAAVWAFDN